MRPQLISALTLILALPLAAQIFPQGIAAGDVRSDSAVLWAHSSKSGEVRFVVVERGMWPPFVKVATTHVDDANVPAKVEISGLNDGANYVYFVIGPDGAREAGHFRTPSAPGARHGLHFGVSGDWRGELAPYPAAKNAAAKDLDFFVEFGDTIYADFPSDAVNKPQATTLAEYRAKHAEVYAAKNGMNTLADIRRSTAIFATIDDHEVTNDFAGGAPASSDPRFGTSTGLINQTPLFQTGMQTFHEFNPIRLETYPASADARTAGRPKLYRYRTFGSDAAMFLLEARSFRDQELAPANPLSSTDVARFLLQSFDFDPATQRPAATQRTLLGSQQLADLKNDLLDAQKRGITWKFVLVPEPIQNFGVFAAEDRYEGYARERSEVLDFIQTNKITNVVFVTADLHGTTVNNLTYQKLPGTPQIATDTFEIITGPIAFDAPLGPTVIGIAVQLGLIDAQSKGFYDALPVAPDPDDTPNDKDDFFKSLLNAQLAPLGYDPVGLAGSPINATLVSGDYVSAHTYGWTEFTIDPVSQQLGITTWGIPAYTRAQMTASPSEVTGRQPVVMSRFTVTPR